MSLTWNEELIEVYRQAEQTVSRPGHRVVLVGEAKYARPCPKCRRDIPQGKPIINYGKVNGSWVLVCLDCVPADPYATPHLKGLRCESCDGPLTGDGSGGSICSNCTFWEEGCTGGRQISCSEVSCCGECRECGGSVGCAECAEREIWEVCCGCGEGYSSFGLGGMDAGRYCAYCTVDQDRVRAFDKDDREQLRKAEAQIAQLEAELRQAEEAREFYAKSIFFAEP